MSIQKLEDLKVWQEARILMKIVYKLTAKFPKSEEYNLKKHMRECARNLTGNIAEGFGRYHFQESIQFYRIARGSLAELKSDSYSSSDIGYLSNGELNELIEQEDKIVNTSYTPMASIGACFLNIRFFGILSVDTESDKPLLFFSAFGGSALKSPRSSLGACRRMCQNVKLFN